MGRHRICKSCIFFIDKDEAQERMSPKSREIYDGWCEELEEERDYDERICDHFIPNYPPRKAR